MNRKESKTREEHLLLSCAVVVFLVSLAIRLAKLIVDPLIMRDCAVYLELAENWYATGQYSVTLQSEHIIPPLPLFTIKELMESGFSSEICGRSLALFLGSSIPVLGFLGAYRIKKDNIFAASIMAGILAVHPTLVAYACQPLRENYYMFSMGLLFICVIDAIKDRSRVKWMLCGVCCAIAFFCRYEAFEMFLILPVIMFFVGWKQHLPRPYCWKCLLFFWGAIAISMVLLLSMTKYDSTFLQKIQLYYHRF